MTANGYAAHGYATGQLQQRLFGPRAEPLSDVLSDVLSGALSEALSARPRPSQRTAPCSLGQASTRGLPGISGILARMNPNDSDEMLMLSYGAGDLQAFAELYRRHSRGLYQFIAWRAPRRDWVEEIVQDCWAALHEARSRYRPEAAFRTFLFQIARNRLIDLLRQKQLKLASEFGGGMAAEEGEDRFAALVDQHYQTGSPEAELEQRQQVSALHQALAGLPPEQKEALVLQQFNGMSIEEIAQVTQVTAETVKSRLRYAMHKLRARLQEPVHQGETA